MCAIHGADRPLEGMNDSMTEGEFSDLFRQTGGILEEGTTDFASITFRSTVTVSDYVPALPAAVTAQAVPPEASTKAGTPTSTPS
jgi:hypothetical protein